jgi:tetratricopeptide (TPR) repeat protein
MKMKTHIKLLPLLAVVLVIALAGGGCTAKVRKAYHERKAEKFYLAGDFDKAEIEYLNVVGSEQDNRLAVARLGGMYYDQGRLQRAMYFLGRANQLDTNNLDVLLKLGFIHTTFGQYREARQAALQILARQPKDEQAPLLLVESATHPTEMATARTELLALQKSGDSAAIETALGNLAMREHDLAAAAASLQKAYALNPKFVPANAALGALCWMQKDTDKAEAFFKVAADNSAPSSPYRMQYARFQMKTGKLDAAKKILADITLKVPGYIPAMMAQAEIAARDKKYDACVALLKKALERDEYNFEAMLFEGEVLQMQGDVTGALQSFNRMIRLFPQSPLAYYYLAAANDAAGDQTTALANLSRALEMLPTFTEAQLLQAQLLLKNGNAGPVVVSLEKLRQKVPDNLDAQLLLADAYRIQGRVDDSLDIYRSLEGKFTNNVRLPLLLGAAYLQKRENKAAQAEFERALQLEPGNLTALGELVDADLAQKKFDAAMQRVRARMDLNPQDIEMHLLTAKIFAAQNDVPRAEEELLRTAAMDTNSPSANLLLAQLYFNQHERDKTLAKLDAALASVPKNVSALVMKAQIHFSEHDYDKAAAAYEKVLAIDPKFSPALNNLACLYADQLHNLDRAYNLADEARKLLPFDPSTADTLGWINYKRGEFIGALALLKQSVAKPVGQTDPEIQAHYGLAAYMNAEESTARTALAYALDKSKGTETVWRTECERAQAILNIDPQTADAAAQTLLEKRVAEMPADPAALTRLAAIQSRAGQADKAIATCQQLLGALPNHVPALIQLAELYAPKDSPKAFDLAKAAYKLAPFDANVLRLTGRLAYTAKDFKLSASTLGDAVKQFPGDPQVRLDLAEALFAVGKISEAQATLDGAAKLNAPPAVAKKIGQLAQLARTLDPASPAPDAQMIPDVLKAAPDYLPALAAQAALADRSGEVATATTAGEKILAQYPDFAPAQRLLALLYARDPAKRDRAYELAVQAHSFYTDDVTLSKTMGLILFAKDDYEHAGGILRQVSQRLPNDAEVFYYLGAAQLKNKDRAAAKTNLQRALTLNLSGKLADSARQMLAELK